MDNYQNNRKISISTIIIIVLLLAVAIETFFLIRNGNNEIIMEDPDDRAMILRDEDGNSISMRLVCDSKDNKIYFYHSNTYQIYNPSTDRITEDGNYEFEDNNTIKLIPIAKENRTINLDNKTIIDGKDNYICEDYE